jgi:hypothetical protein
MIHWDLVLTGTLTGIGIAISVFLLWGMLCEGLDLWDRYQTSRAIKRRCEEAKARRQREEQSNSVGGAA